MKRAYLDWTDIVKSSNYVDCYITWREDGIDLAGRIASFTLMHGNTVEVKLKEGSQMKRAAATEPWEPTKIGAIYFCTMHSNPSLGDDKIVTINIWPGVEHRIHLDPLYTLPAPFAPETTAEQARSALELVRAR